MLSMAMFAQSRRLLKTPNANFIKSISTFTFLSQDPQIAEPQPPPPSATALPPNPATGSPLYKENWRNPIPATPPPNSQSLIPLGFLHQTPTSHLHALSQTLDLEGIMNLYADWITAKDWTDIKQLFEYWIRCLDKNGKPNRPDVGLYNHYLMANLMLGASAADLLDYVAQMDGYNLIPNTASFNLVLKAMDQAREFEAAEKLLERMIETGKEFKESLPDDESFALVIGMLLSVDHVDAALKYIDLNLKSGYALSADVFEVCVRGCINHDRLDALVAIIERCKNHNKALFPPWNMCKYMVDVATQANNSELAFYALGFLNTHIARGDNARPPHILSVEETLLLTALETAGKTYNTKLLDGAWLILIRSLRSKKAPSPESYHAKINAYASMGNLEKAFGTLQEFERIYGNTSSEAEDLFSPFGALHPLVVACCKNGFATLDSVYYQLETLNQADTPYKSVAALNCILLGCANIWDVDRAYQTFEAISTSFGVTPDIHSYNCLISVFGKLKKRDEAVKVFEHFRSLNLKPNAITFLLLVDAHLVAKDPKAALSVIDEMVIAGFQPPREILRKIRRRSVREMDFESDDQVQALARQFKISIGTETRRDLLFNLQFGGDYA